MGWWSAYFLVKFVLFAGGYIDFSIGLNLLFACYTALPPANPRQRFAKNLLGVPLAIMLLYRDSWLPPVARLLSQAHNVASFSVPYLLELTTRLINWRLLVELVVVLAIYVIASRKLRLSTFVFLGIFGMMLWPHQAPAPGVRVMTAAAPMAGGAITPVAQVDPRNLRPEALNAMLAQFYSGEQQRQVRFAPVIDDDAPYDIVFLHVCSLAADDIAAVGRKEPLLDRFDVSFTAFNSGASYSGPAAIRLLRGNCGQTSHKDLYSPSSRECLVVDGLQSAGFDPQWLMNHDGRFGDFFGDVRDRGGMPAALTPPTGAMVAQHAFDGTPIYSDYSVLSRWWQERQKNPARRMVLYYNSISLHDGNRVAGNKDSSFAARLATLSAEMGKFLDDVAASKRRVIVVFIPEHGAAVRGDRKQFPGLREIPTPAITRVPAGIVLVNAPRTEQRVQTRIDAPTSYFAANELLSRFINDNPFAKPDLNLATYTQSLPETQAVSENDGTVVMKIGEHHMVRTPDGAWSAWD
jgi:cellulose synthase operon protein YhjU